MIDMDQFQERAAIMEYDGAMPRFRAETLAAQAQGYQRREVIDEIRKRDLAGSQNQREANERHSQGDMPGMQPRSKEQERPLPERHVQA